MSLSRMWSVLFLLVTSLMVPESSGLSSPVRDSWESTVIASLNASIRPSSGHSRICSAVSTCIMQQGHLLLHPSQCLWRRFLFFSLKYSSPACMPRLETTREPPRSASDALGASPPCLMHLGFSVRYYWLIVSLLINILYTEQNTMVFCCRLIRQG